MATRFSVEAVFKAIDKFTAPITAMQNRVGKFTRSLNSSFKYANKYIDKAAGSLWSFGKTAAITGAVGIGLVTTAAIGLIEQFSKIEDATAAFTPMMGGADKAAKLVEALNQAAADTPFQFETLADTAKQLLPVMNGDIEKTIKTINMLGDTAGGNAQKLDTITRGYTKAMLKGKVDMESLNMIAEAGVPVYDQLAKSIGKTPKQMFKMISAGKITTAQLTAVFQKMTSKGGMFFQGMEIASQTTSGLWSTLKDNITLTAASLGEVLAPTVKELITGATEMAQKLRAWVNNNKEIIRSKFLEYVDKARILVAKLIDYFSDINRVSSDFSTLVDIVFSLAKAVGWLFSHADQVAKFIKWIAILVVTFKALAIIMAIVNAVMMANPIGLIVVAIGLAIAAVAALIIYWDDLVKMFNNLPDWLKTGITFLATPILVMVEAIKLGIKAFGYLIDQFKAAGKWLGVIDDTSVDINKNVNQTADPNFSVVPQVVSPQDRTAQAVNESRTTSYAELLIKDSTGKATLSKQGDAPGVNFSMVPTGSF